MSRRDRLILWGLVGLGFVLRLVTLGDRPFDGDEGVIASIATMSLAEVLGATARDVHPPLYHLLVSASVGLFGLSEWSVRLVGVLAGVGTVILAPLLGRVLKIDWKILGLLLATSPYLVNLSQDARMYSLLVLLALVELVLLWQVVTSTTQRWAPWLQLTLGALLLVYTHHISWLILASYAVVALIWYRQFFLSRMKFLLGSLVLFAIGYLPQLPTTLAQVQGRLAEQSTGAGLMDRVSGVLGAMYRMVAGRTFLDLDPGSVVARLATDPLAVTAFLITLLVPLGVIVTGKLRDREVAERRQVVIIIELGLLAALLIGTIGTQASRYLAYLAPLILSFLGLGLALVWPKVWGKVLAVIVGLTVLAGLWTQYGVHNQSAGVDEYARYIERNAQPGDVVLVRGAFAGGESWAFRHYLTSDVAVSDLYADYDVGQSNLDELRALDPATAATNLLDQGATRVWYFDNTYADPTLTNLPDTYQAEVIPLGFEDKEAKPLTLTLVTQS